MLGTERRPYLRFEYLTCRLAETPAERWLDSDNVVARVNLPNMRITGHDRVEAAERLRHAPETGLEAWADNVLDAETLDDVFGSPP